MKTRRDGFTLLELLIVLLIIGILISVALPIFQGIKIKAKFPNSLIMCRRIEMAFDLYIMEVGSSEVFSMTSGKHVASLQTLQSLGYDVPQEDADFYYNIGFWAHMGLYMIDATTKSNGMALYALCIYADGKKLWAINKDHPWAKYISIPGAIYLDSQNPWPPP
jgi:prepilin-type N-terminal cleavage/methylation domain-containing protein